MNSASERRLLVVHPDPRGPLDNFDSWLTEDGVRAHSIRPYAGDPVPADLREAGADALVVLGGAMSSLDDDRYPWLEDIRALLRGAHAEDRPALGICLGAQLMAQAHGGRVEVGRNGTEGGLICVRWRESAKTDDLLADLPDPFLVGAMHSDAVVELPPSASWLAESDRYPHQAFRVGARSWGLQFHPEVSVDTMRMWVSCMADEGADVSEVAHRTDEFERRQDAVQEGTSTLARRFAGMIGAAG